MTEGQELAARQGPGLVQRDAGRDRGCEGQGQGLASKGPQPAQALQQGGPDGSGCPEKVLRIRGV